MERMREKNEPEWKQKFNALIFTNNDRRRDFQQYLEELSEEKAAEIITWLEGIRPGSYEGKTVLGSILVIGRNNEGAFTMADVSEEPYENEATENGVQIICSYSRSSGSYYSIRFPQTKELNRAIRIHKKELAIVAFQRARELAQQYGNAQETLERLIQELGDAAH